MPREKPGASGSAPQKQPLFSVYTSGGLCTGVCVCVCVRLLAPGTTLRCVCGALSGLAGGGMLCRRPRGGHFWRQAKEVQLTLAHERRLWSERISGVAVGSWLQAELGPGLRLHAQTRDFCVPLRSQPPWPGQDGSVCSAAGLQGRRPPAGTGGHVRGSWRPCRWPCGQGSQAC